MQWELVVEKDSIRWGRVDFPNRQRRLAINQLKRLIDEKSDNQILADIGRIVFVPIGDNVLMSSSDRVEFVEFMRQKFPGLKIETQ